MTAADWISDRRTLIDAALPGPWSTTHGASELPCLWSDAPGEDGEFIAKFLTKGDLPSADWIADARTSLPAALDALEAVLRLHSPAALQVLTGDCAAEECVHEELDDCQTCDFTYCSGCHEFAEKIDSYYPERDMRLTAYPCPTVTAITAALGIEVQP